MREVAVVLHNVRSAHNVGSIFRTADGAGVSRVYLAGLTPTPVDRFGRTRKEIAKTALRADTYIAWEHVSSTTKLLERLRAEGWHVVGVEQDKQAYDYRTLHRKKKTIFVFGNEVRGLSPAVRKVCDELVEIPMRGEKESLNVAVAAGIILFSC